MDAKQAVDHAKAELAALGTQKRAEASKEYLKSDLDFLGVTVPDTRKVAVAFVKANPRLSRQDLIELTRECWSRPIFEIQSFSDVMLARLIDRLEPDDIDLLEWLINQSHTWAHVDSLATGPIADLLARHPGSGAILDRWSTDKNFWLRRTAMLALLPDLRRGEGDLSRFLRYADAMLDEKEFFIRKAIGWILREISKKRPQPVYDFVKPRINRISGVTFREAVKYLPDEQREELTVAYRSR